MDPSVLLRAYKSPQWPDPVEEYKGFLSLRQMMDLGKLRQVQLRQTELENQQKQRDLEEYETYRRGVSLLKPNSSLEETIQALGPKYGAAHFKLTHEAQTALNQQKAAESAQAKAALELSQKRGQSLADMMYANRLLPEGERQTAWDEAWGLPVDLAPTEAQTQAQIAQGYGGKEQQAMANAAAEAAQKGLLRPLEVRKATAEALTAEAKPTQEALETTKRQDEQAGRNLGLVYDQPSLTKWYSELPAEQRARIGPPPTFNPANMQRLNRMFMTAEQRVQADKRTDKLLTPDEFAQQLELARARAAAVQEGKPPTQGEELLAGYAARVAMANKGFEKLTMGTGEMAWNKVAPFDFMKTEAGLNFGQDERNFINAVLRRESGAAISPGEFAEARSQYIPQPNDPISTLEKKRRNRLVVQQSLIRGAGRAYVDPDQLLRDAGVEVPTLNPATKTAQPGPAIPNPIVEVKRGPDGKLR